jgi:hypothetical protein
VRAWAAIVLVLVLAAPAAASDATYPDADGHTIHVVAPTMADDPVRDKLVTDLLGSLVHGAEMNQLTVQLAANAAEHQANCGGAAGCYKPPLNTLFVRGYDPGDSEGPEDDGPLRTADALPRGLLAHEFGHHVAAHRSNPGALNGDALANGTKRWATYVGVCPRVKAGQLGTSYNSSPAEGFAESYRALHFPENLGFWFLDPLLKPDPIALDLIREDVVNPWTGPETVAIKGRFKRRGRSERTRRVKLPLDGALTASVKTTGTLKATVSLAAPDAKLGPSTTLGYEVCGARAATFTVHRVRGRGKFTLTVLRP